MNLRRSRLNSGFTLIEITVVVAVLLGLITVVFIGVVAYKKGSNRAQCIQNISTSQKAVRSFANLRGLNPGDSVDNLQDLLYGEGRFLPILPECPSDGEYTFLENQIPEVGQPYLACDFEDHVPKNFSGW